MTYRTGITALLCALFAQTVAAAAPTTPPVPPCDAARAASLRTSIVSLQVENDLLAGTDAQYTNGVKLTWVSPNIESFESPLLPAWVRCSNEQVRGVIGWFLPPQAAVRNMVVTLGQSMYTPADRDRTTVDPGDRPYAGWTYLGFGYNVRFDPDPVPARRITSTAVLNTLEIDIGVVGPHSYAKETQDTIHRLRGFDRFLGWAHQLGDEPGLQIVWEQKFRPRIGPTAKSLGSRLRGNDLGSVVSAKAETRRRLQESATNRCGSPLAATVRIPTGRPINLTHFSKGHR